ncbi:MAG TPA: hypothetical protein VE591_15680 [Candidatus Acidoferrum sp.]|nr:hypothetical protein [Candidatus Acidoferrum sp.]
MHTSDGSSSGTVIGTLHGIGPALPFTSPQISVAFPLTNGGGRFAATAEDIVHLPGSGVEVGAGIGAGRLDQPLRTGVLYDLLASVRITHHVDLAGRFYSGFNNFTGQGTFVGLNFHL